MTLVLKADCSAGGAYLTKDLTAVTTDWYLSTRFLVFESTFTAIAADEFTANLLDWYASAVNIDGFFLTGDGVDGSSHNFSFGNRNYWTNQATTNPSLGGTTGEWHDLDVQYVSGTILWKIDGATLFSYSPPLGPFNLDQIILGGLGPNGVSGEIYYLGAIKIGTTLGGTDIFVDDFSSGDFSKWTSTTGSVSLVADPAPAPPPPPPPPVSGYLLIAFGFNTYDTTAEFTAVPAQTFSIDRGRQYELDKTQAGTATVTILDQTGLYDPTNPNGAYHGQIGPLTQAKIQGINPVDGTTSVLFTGFIETWTYVPDITGRWMVLTIGLTDAYEPLTRAEVVPDSTDTTTLQPQQVDDRIRLAEADFNPSPSSGSPSGAGWPPAWDVDAGGRSTINSGNADMQGTIYNPQTTILSIIQDAADAEFPNVANVFMSRNGNIDFRGRWPRFVPEYFAAINPDRYHFWEVGDRTAANDGLDVALIASIEWILDLKNVINACLCVPYGLAENSQLGAIQDQMKTAPSSITTYGARLLSIPDLLVESSVAGLTAPAWQASTSYAIHEIVRMTSGYSSTVPSLFYARNAGTSGGTEPTWPTSSDQTVMDGSIEWGIAEPGGDGAGTSRSDSNNSGINECKHFGQYYVDNYSQPVPMISRIEFHSIDPFGPQGATHWAFLLGVEIGDVVTVYESNVGGGGFQGTAFFIEGIHYVVRPLEGGTLDYQLELDLSPRAWYQKFNGVTYYIPPGGGLPGEQLTALFGYEIL